MDDFCMMMTRPTAHAVSAYLQIKIYEIENRGRRKTVLFKVDMCVLLPHHQKAKSFLLFFETELKAADSITL